ncbi:MAG: dienelactone hydrolase family protein [Polyangiaceae bacterium]
MLKHDFLTHTSIEGASSEGTRERKDVGGPTMRSRVSTDASFSGQRPGILLFPDALGLGEHVKERADRLAKLGYVTLACDYYGDGTIFDSLDAAKKVLTALREGTTRIRSRARSALEAFSKHDEVDTTKLVALGYCFGGTMALELARSGAPLRGVCGFHSGLATKSPEDARNIRGKVLVCIGADDPSITPEQRASFEKEMREARVDWQLHLYGGVVHSFTDPNAARLGRPEFARYDADADDRSWQELVRFLEELFT